MWSEKRSGSEEAMRIVSEDILVAWLHLSDMHMGHGDAAHGWDQRLIDVNYICRPCCLTRKCYRIVLAKSWAESLTPGLARISRLASTARHSRTRR